MTLEFEVSEGDDTSLFTALHLGGSRLDEERSIKSKHHKEQDGQESPSD